MLPPGAVDEGRGRAHVRLVGDTTARGRVDEPGGTTLRECDEP